MNRIPILLCLLTLAAAPLAALGDGVLVDASLSTPRAVRSVVKSDKWHIRRKPHKIEELSGNVTYRQGERFLRADWVVYDHKLKVLRARGRIRIEHPTDEGDKITLRGERAHFDQNLQKGSLEGKSKTDSVRFDRVNKSRNSTGHGRAQVLRFDAAEESLRLTGRRPYVTGRESRWSAAVQADRITVYRGGPEGRRIVAEGRTQGWIHFKGRFGKIGGRP